MHENFSAEFGRVHVCLYQKFVTFEQSVHTSGTQRQVLSIIPVLSFLLSSFSRDHADRSTLLLESVNRQNEGERSILLARIPTNPVKMFTNRSNRRPKKNILRFCFSRGVYGSYEVVWVYSKKISSQIWTLAFPSDTLEGLVNSRGRNTRARSDASE